MIAGSQALRYLLQRASQPFSLIVTEVVVMDINLVAGWFWILVGLVSGAIIGLFFHNDDWLGGYGSWRRRMIRLGHISFLGTGLLNLAFALSCEVFVIEPKPRLAAMMFLIGAATMPAVCFLSAWKKNFRQLFFIPVLGLIIAVTELLRNALSN